MANPYGRKKKADTPANPADVMATRQMTTEEQLAHVQKQLLTLQNANEALAQKLQDALVNQATMAAGGSVTIMPPPDSGSSVLEVPAENPEINEIAPKNRANFGKVSLVRVYSDLAPAQTKIPCVVQCAKMAPNGKVAFFRRRFYTDTPIELPELAIKTLELPETREYEEEVGSIVYEAAIRGDMGPAKEACQSVGLEDVKWRGEKLVYIGYIYHYTVSRIAERQGSLFVPTR